MSDGSSRPLRPARWLAPALAAALLVCAAPAPARDLRLGDRELREGTQGADVRELQRTLARLDIAVPVTGLFGPETTGAVRRFEHRVGVAGDGVVTPRQASAMRARAGTLALGRRTLRRGMEGRDVRRLQDLLTDMGVPVPADGEFGRRTERAVRRYERREGLRVDGVVSPAQSRSMIRRLAAASSAPVAVPENAVSPGARRFPIAGSWTAPDAGGHFGDRGGEHQGEDLAAACGTPLVAVEPSVLVFTGKQARAGNYLVLRGLESGQDAVFMHMLEPTPVARGTMLAAGTQVGRVGRTGRATGCHLHIEVWTAPGWYRGGRPIDPRPSLAAWTAAAGS